MLKKTQELIVFQFSDKKYTKKKVKRLRMLDLSSVCASFGVRSGQSDNEDEMLALKGVL